MMACVPVIISTPHSGITRHMAVVQHGARWPAGSPHGGRTMNALLDYIDAWRRHDIDRVLGTLDDDCVSSESYGPVYRGCERVDQWMRAWFGAGGSVESWDVTWHGGTSDFLVAEWRFGSTWKGDSETFDG